MSTDGQLTEQDLKKHPTNTNWTMPKSFGVWQLPEGTKGKRYRWGNYPGKGLELDRAFGANKRVALYASRKKAKSHAEALNDDPPRVCDT